MSKHFDLYTGRQGPRKRAKTTRGGLVVSLPPIDRAVSGHLLQNMSGAKIFVMCRRTMIVFVLLCSFIHLKLNALFCNNVVRLNVNGFQAQAVIYQAPKSVSVRFASIIF